jgi:superfamily II DNA helicase RecQ
MQKSAKKLKQKIIEEYLNNTKQSIEKIAIAVEASALYTQTVIDVYKQKLELRLPLYIEKSLDLPNIYYLFTETEEKMINLDGRMIVNIDKFTNYERVWMNINKGFY